ncbi:HNH endonuclease domain-containing protein [Tanacetum coccineum]
MSSKFTKHADGLKQKNITSSPPSQPRHRSGEDVANGKESGGDVANGKDDKCAFTNLMKHMCWKKAGTVPGRNPSRWRKDAVNNVVCKGLSNCHGCLCYEYDHIHPHAKGGASVLDNCQILQTKVNRRKLDKVVDKSDLRGYSCNYKFSSFSPSSYSSSYQFFSCWIDMEQTPEDAEELLFIHGGHTSNVLDFSCNPREDFGSSLVFLVLTSMAFTLS